jgi:hypothetical protein
MEAVAETKPKRGRGRPKGNIPTPYVERATIVQDTLLRLEKGETTDAIAKSHNVEPRTLRSWLLVDCPPQAEHQRARYIAGQLQTAIEEIEAANDHIPLARARERFRSWAWIAERRLPQLFAQKQEVKIDVNVHLADRLVRARERVINNDASQLPQSSTSITDAEIVK